MINKIKAQLSAYISETVGALICSNYEWVVKRREGWGERVYGTISNYTGRRDTLNRLVCITDSTTLVLFYLPRLRFLFFLLNLVSFQSAVGAARAEKEGNSANWAAKARGASWNLQSTRCTLSGGKTSNSYFGQGKQQITDNPSI